jgi:hypothetical protein
MNREEMKLRIKGMENQLSSQSWKTPPDNNVFVVIHSAIDTTIKNVQHVLQAPGCLLLPCRRLNSLSNMTGFNILTIVLTILFAIPSCNIIEDIISDTKSTKRIKKIKFNGVIINYSYTENRLSPTHIIIFDKSNPLISDVELGFEYKEDSVIRTTTELGIVYRDAYPCLLNKNGYISRIDYTYRNYSYNYSQNGYLQSIVCDWGYPQDRSNYQYDENWNLIESDQYLFSYTYTDIPNLSGIYVFSMLVNGRSAMQDWDNFRLGLLGKAPAYLPKEGDMGGDSFLFDYELDKEGYVKRMTIEWKHPTETSYTFYEYFYE